MRHLTLLLLLTSLVGCDDTSESDGGVDLDGAVPGDFRFTVVTFNSGTTLGLAHDGPPADGYTMDDAITSDTFYGNGLAWTPAVDAARSYFASVDADIVVFQEIFNSDGCETIPATARAGFVCDGWMPGDPSVIQRVLGPRYQVACNLGKPDKCLAVRNTFGRIRGCAGDICLDGLDGAPVSGCGGGSRVGRGVIDLVGGGELTVVHVHGTSGIEAADQGCRTAQFEQVFEDFDGAPMANGVANLVMGDFNTDPVRAAASDPSAARLRELVDAGGFGFVTDIARSSPATYLDLFNIDHVISDVFVGACVAEGITPGTDAVTDAVYFDHVPIFCELAGEHP